MTSIDRRQISMTKAPDFEPECLSIRNYGDPLPSQALTRNSGETGQWEYFTKEHSGPKGQTKIPQQPHRTLVTELVSTLQSENQC